MKQTLTALSIVVGLGCSFSPGQLVHRNRVFLQFGIVDCFGQGRVLASRAQGMIVDPTGVPVPGARISLTAEGKPSLETRSGSDGRFLLKAPAGLYIFRVDVAQFAGPEIELDLGKDSTSLLHPNSMYVMLGLAGSFCPLVTTSDRMLKRETELNKQRLKESTQNNATPK